MTSLRPSPSLFEPLGVRYAIGGSIASTVHGEIRSTVDADIVAELKQEHIESFVRGLGDDYYLSEEKHSSPFGCGIHAPNGLPHGG